MPDALFQMLGQPFWHVRDAALQSFALLPLSRLSFPIAGNIVRDYVYFNGRKIAFLGIATGNQHYYWSDHLGSVRVMSNSDGSAIEWEGDYYPFGNKNVFNNSVDNYFLFTGYEFSAESSNSPAAIALLRRDSSSFILGSLT